MSSVTAHRFLPFVKRESGVTLKCAPSCETFSNLFPTVQFCL
jgi:hypothetical protein